MLLLHKLGRFKKNNQKSWELSQPLADPPPPLKVGNSIFVGNFPNFLQTSLSASTLI